MPVGGDVELGRVTEKREACEDMTPYFELERN
jgi:hypothetical protein